MSLPESFIEQYKPKADGTTVFGVPLLELSREELLAVVGYIGHEAEQTKQRYRRHDDFMAAVRRLGV